MFYYAGKDNYYAKKILRVRSLKKSASTQEILPACDDIAAAESLFKSKLRPFLLPTQPVVVDGSTMITLGLKAGPSRPLCRVRTNSPPKNRSIGFVQDDLALLFGNETVYIEVKPKGAILSRSRLIPPNVCSILSKYTKLDIHVRNFSVHEIESRLENESLYDPRDLLSGLRSRVERALNILQKTKSRWLRVLISGEFVAASDEVSRAVSTRACEYDDPLCVRYLGLAATILCANSSCLSAIYEMQALDCVDKLGLEVLWAHLKDLLGITEAGRKVWLHYLRARSFLEQEDEEYTTWKKAVSYETPEAALLEHNEEKHRQALEAVNRMPADICARMVADSMMAGAAKDCSIILSLAPLLSDDASCKAPIVDEVDGSKWMSTVRVIDIGAKVLTKIETWADFDRKLVAQLRTLSPNVIDTS